MSEKPRAGLVRELDTVGIDLQNLDDVGVVGTHHMQTHLRRENQAAALQIHTVSRHQTSGSAQRQAETSLQSPSSNAAIKLLHRSFLPARERERLLARLLFFAGAQHRVAAALDGIRLKSISGCLHACLKQREHSSQINCALSTTQTRNKGVWKPQPQTADEVSRDDISVARVCLSAAAFTVQRPHRVGLACFDSASRGCVSCSVKTDGRR